MRLTPSAAARHAIAHLLNWLHSLWPPQQLHTPREAWAERGPGGGLGTTGAGRLLVHPPLPARPGRPCPCPPTLCCAADDGGGPQGHHHRRGGGQGGGPGLGHLGPQQHPRQEVSCRPGWGGPLGRGSRRAASASAGPAGAADECCAASSSGLAPTHTHTRAPTHAPNQSLLAPTPQLPGQGQPSPLGGLPGGVKIHAALLPRRRGAAAANER